MSVSLYPLASLEQIENSPSKADGLPADLEEDLRAFGCKLIYEAGVLLKQYVTSLANTSELVLCHITRSCLESKLLFRQRKFSSSVFGS